MKVFIPSYWFEDSFADNVRATLEAMGHEVATLGRRSARFDWMAPVRAARRTLGNLLDSWPAPEDYRALRRAREFRPDLVLATTGTIHPSILDDLGKTCGGRRVLWWGDPAANSPRWGVLDPGWDFVFMKDRTAVAKLRLAGRNAHLLHEAMNPAWHRPLSGQENEDVVVAGNCYAFRQAVLLRLIADGVPVRLYGPPPPRWSHPEIRRIHSGRYVVREEKSRIFGRGLACLNTFSLAEGDSLNCRAFEIAGAGGLQLIEGRPSIGECFEPGTELLVFNTYEELRDHIARARRSPGEMAGIREAGARRALGAHTYKHRLETILRMAGR